jgi:hypothetical protein
LIEAWQKFRPTMDGVPFIVSTLVNKECFAKTLIDTGCLSYGIVSQKFVSKHQLQCVPISPRQISSFEGVIPDEVTEVAAASIDIDGHYEERAFFYVVPRVKSYDMILGTPWVERQDVRLNLPQSECVIKSTNTVVRNQARRAELTIDCVEISAVGYAHLVRKRNQNPTAKESIEIFSATAADITKALATKTRSDPRKKLPMWCFEFLDIFDPEQNQDLPPLRGPGFDHAIEIEKKDGKDQQVPWGPLYKMTREELLVLRKTLTEHLGKGFIRVSNSPAAAPVLFVRKPGGGLRFCVDYRSLNRITRKDRYPLPLIYETLQNIGEAKWFTKLDVVAAFHKIRIAEGNEWMTAFRTRYGLYEWMVTPFGLANAPSTFQKYINWALRDYLDEFCSAYVDDILIYTNGSKEQHREHVKKVLVRLRDAGLQLDIDKCEFEVKETKYLGFIITAETGIKMDPAKVEAILNWEAPTSVRGVRSFLGFANFYRTFIRNYSDMVMPLTRLTHKEQEFEWTQETEDAFEKLKKIFISAPTLIQFNPDRETILETDSSGWCVGGMLMQVCDDNAIRPCAFFSKKNNPAECNYEVYDKEMLAIVRCLEEWDSELRSVHQFEVRTDHKNLEYFMTARKLTERQMRWSLILSRFNFTISYIPGKQNERADALSRREQDMPKGIDDDRLQYRTIQLLKPDTLKNLPRDTITAMPVQTRAQKATEDKGPLEKAFPAAPLYEEEDRAPSEQAFPMAPSEVPVLHENQEADEEEEPAQRPELDLLWERAEQEDPVYEKAAEAVREGRRLFPSDLQLKVSIAECALSTRGKLMFRGRRWVPDNEELRTKLIQEVHDSKACGHPGRDNCSAILARRFFWPKMSQDVRRFVRNCDACGRNKAWRDRRQGFLKPLPIPERIWQEISIDFIVDLPESKGCTNLVVITDRLGKGVIFDGLPNIQADTVAEWFVRTYYRHHFLPKAIVSDRGTQFTGHLWKRICQLLNITRRLSTAYHPETDGATERMNQTLETYLRMFIDHAQDDWYDMLPSAEIAINGRNAASTGVSPFFLQHGYHVDPLNVTEEIEPSTTLGSPVKQAEAIVRKLQDARQWAQTAMATAQQVQETATNRNRQQSPNFKVGDKVWLNLTNIRTDRPTKKLDAKHAKFTVTEVIGSHNYRLDTPPGIEDIFHSQLLRPAAMDPLPSQQQDDTQPLPQLVGEDEEYEVEKIVDERVIKRGRRRTRKFLVKWVGYAKPTWESYEAMKNTTAVDSWEEIRRNPDESGQIQTDLEQSG